MSTPTIHVKLQTIEDGVVVTTLLPVKAIKENEDGSYTVMISTPIPALSSKPDSNQLYRTVNSLPLLTTLKDKK